MGSAEHGEMPSETPEAPETPITPVAPLPSMPALTPLAPVIAPAVATAEAKEAEAPEPSSSKPDTEEQETEGKFPESLTVNEAVETERESKRPRLTPAEVEAEGMPDADLSLKMLRLCQSSLEYTARQSKALQAVQEQLGETASLAFHSESCMRYALAAINQSSGHIKGMHWQLTGGRSSEHVSCKSLLQQLATNTGKLQTSMGKLVETLEKQGVQASERDKQFSDVLLALQGQMADAYARGSGTGSAPAGTPLTPTVGVASMGMGSVGAAAAAFPPQAPPVLPCGATIGTMAGSYVPPPPANPAPAPAPAVPAARNPIVLQVRQPDGNVVQPQASPTRHFDDALRSNSGYMWCDDNCFRRLM
eukprot:s5343_g3.t1